MVLWGDFSGHMLHSMLALGLLAGRRLSAAALEGSGGKPATFGEDVAFLKKHVEVIVLSDPSGQAKVAVVPAWQGRVMTSTAGGDDGPSYGWINRELIASGKLGPHINAFGGEERFWLGPEGGQFSWYFKKGDPFDLAHWQVPALIDTEAFPITQQNGAESVSFAKRSSLANYIGSQFDMAIARDVRMLPRTAPAEVIPGLAGNGRVNMVAYRTENRITNSGPAAWTKETGMPSIWILGMFNPSPSATIVVPFKQGSEAELGPVVNDVYFGKIPADRLKVGEGVIFFRGDGGQRGKIGLSPRRATPFAGAYDAASQTLTVITFNMPAEPKDYVNAMWELQKEPFAGDVVNAYNDGPPAPGAKPLGPFFEVEASSPAAALAPGQTILHQHTTFHFQGAPADLDPIARAALGVSLAEIEAAFGK